MSRPLAEQVDLGAVVVTPIGSPGSPSHETGCDNEGKRPRPWCNKKSNRAQGDHQEYDAHKSPDKGNQPQAKVQRKSQTIRGTNRRRRFNVSFVTFENFPASRIGITIKNSKMHRATTQHPCTGDACMLFAFRTPNSRPSGTHAAVRTAFNLNMVQPADQ